MFLELPGVSREFCLCFDRDVLQPIPRYVYAAAESDNRFGTLAGEKRGRSIRLHRDASSRTPLSAIQFA